MGENKVHFSESNTQKNINTLRHKFAASFLLQVCITFVASWCHHIGEIYSE